MSEENEKKPHGTPSSPPKPEAEIPKLRIDEGFEKAQNKQGDIIPSRIPIDQTPLPTPPPKDNNQD